MPTPDSILSWATLVANEWRWLAISWHLALGIMLVAAALSRSRVSQRFVALFCVLLVVSVAVVAWISGNPFNGLLFTFLSIALLRAAASLPKHVPLTSAPWPWSLAGAALVGFGWLYPHFLITDTPSSYAYASPLGVLPCPTLSLIIGMTFLAGGLHSAGWNLMLTAAGVLYGWIGVFRLGVTLDVALLAGAILLGTRAATRTANITDDAARRAPQTAAP